MNTHTPWRDDPALASRFHSEHPDDLQVIVHDGGPRLTQAAPELMWVTVTAVAAPQGPVYEARVLNVPHGLGSVQMGSAILFVAPLNAEHPLRVTPKYLSQRSSWSIVPCDRCGLSELFDAPSDLIAAIFPGLEPGQVPEAFTSFCPLCGGVQIVQSNNAAPAEPAAEEPQRPWWQVWKR